MSKITTIPQNTFIGFRGNKTVADAQNETPNNCVNITDTGELYFNGKRLGTNDAEDKFFDNAIDTDGTIYATSVKISDGVNIKSYIDSNTSRVYRCRGSVPTLASLFRLACAIGDVYNVIDAFEIKTGDNAGKYPKGTNVVVTKAFNGNNSLTRGDESCIDPLSGITDLSNYVTTDTLDTTKAEFSQTYLSKSDFNSKILDYNKTYVIKESQLPAETDDSGVPSNETVLTFLMNIRNAIADNKYIIIQNDIASSSGKGYYIIECASYKNNSFSLLYSYSHKNKVEIQVRLLGSTTQDPIYTGYSLKKINTTLATSDDIQEIKDLLKLA